MLNWKSLGDVDIKLVADIDTASECARWLSTHDRIAVDTETTGLSPRFDRVRFLQLGDANTSYVIPFESTISRQSIDSISGRTLQPPANSLIGGWGGFGIELLSKFDGIIDMFNAKFDTTIISNYLGVRYPEHLIHDVRLMLHVLDSTGSLSLKKASDKFVDPKASLGQEILDKALGKHTGWGWDNVPLDFTPYWFYGGLDTILTRRLSQVLEPRVKEEALDSYKLELAVSWPCATMEQHGVVLDVPYTKSFLDELECEISETDKWCERNYHVSAGSNDSVISILQREGVKLTKRTKSGFKFSLDKEVLEDIDHPLAVKVLQRRQAIHIASYLRKYLELASDGIIYPSINTVGGIAKSPFESGGAKGVRTGRMSMSNPNFQQVPKRTSVGSRVRRCFIAPVGYTWVRFDAEQIESRILAHLSQDPGMIAAFEADGDFFVNLAIQMFNDPSFTIDDPRRQLIKNGTYAKVYGAGIEQFSKTAHVSFEQARLFMQSFNQAFPGIQRFINYIQELGQHRLIETGEAYVCSPLTSRKHVADQSKIYTLVNYLIQGLAGEILKLKIVEATQAELDKYMLFPVHDEIDLAVPNEDLDDVINSLKELLNDDTLLTVPITWSYGTGTSWGDCD